MPRRPRRQVMPRNDARSWYRIEDSAGDTARVDLMDEIGYYGVSAAEFVSEINSLVVGTLELHISSPGGSVFDGLAIFQALIDHPARVNVQIDGLAASAASFIAMAGDQVLVAPKASVMIHDASGMTIGGSADHREMADLLDKMSDNIASIYADKAGGTVEDWRTAMLAETWYSAEEAVTAGLADGIVGKPASGEPDGDEESEPDGDEPVMPRPIAASFKFAGRDAAPDPKLPVASVEAPEAPPVVVEEPAETPAEPEPADAPEAAPEAAVEPVETPSRTDDAGAESPATDEDTWGALVAQLTSTIAPLDPVGDALASLREAMQ